MKKIFLLIVSICIFFSGCAVQNNTENNQMPAVNEPVKSVWLAYFELESLTTECASEKEFRKAFSNVLKNIKELSLNTITVQVRPCADAFYASSYFPVSKYCFGVQGAELKYDPLAVMVDCAHKSNIRIEAWINPYRVSQDNDITALSDDNIAKKWYQSSDKQSNVYIDEKIFFNPASNDVNELIVNGVREIVENYAVDAIHFDDYFYPTVKEEIDREQYEQYLENNGKLSLDDWRRENVSKMIKSVYETVKSINETVLFGVSPQSRVSTNYNTLYADVEKWASEEGYIDYICPQVYFGFYNESQPFTRTVREWNERTEGCKLYIGLPLYKAGNEDKYASDNASYALNEFVENNNVISRQIAYLDEMSNVSGYYIYSYSYISDKNNEAVKKEVENIKALN